MTANLGWFGIVRLGLVNAALGAVVALVTFTLNRVMAVELALPALVPGALIALHYAVQLLRPRIGYGADLSGRRTPWIAGGLALLCAGGALATLGVAVMAPHRLAGICLATAAYAMVGAGVGAVGTSSLALLAGRVAPSRRAASATIFWLLMIFGAVFTAALSSALLHPFSNATLLRTGVIVPAGAFVVGMAALLGVERGRIETTVSAQQDFAGALRDIWREAAARRFTIFVFVAMLAYSAQELILEPFAGAVFHLSPARTAGLTGLHQGGVLVGMLLVALGGSVAGAGRARAMRTYMFGGCAASATCLAGLACAGLAPQGWPIQTNFALLGIGNGAFAVAAIGAMLGLARQGRHAREGARMGLWGAAQAIAMGLGGLLSTAASDLSHRLLGAQGPAYAAIFLCQAALFLLAARTATLVFANSGAASPPVPLTNHEITA